MMSFTSNSWNWKKAGCKKAAEILFRQLFHGVRCFSFTYSFLRNFYGNKEVFRCLYKN
jgi:hypothetical protein